MVVEEVEHARLHDELDAELHADLLDRVERLDLERARLGRVVEELRVLDVRRRDLRRALARGRGSISRRDLATFFISENFWVFIVLSVHEIV